MTPLDNWLGLLEQDRHLDEPDRLRERAVALDRLERWFPDLGEEDAGTRTGTDQVGVRARARAQWHRLEAADERLFQSIRKAIRSGEGARALSPWVRSIEGADGCAGGDAYDHLDILASGILPFDTPEPRSVPLAADMVFYQPTPARHIFDLLLRTGLHADDVLIDLGAGLGHVPLLAAICTGAQSIGIELEPAYVACAQRAARTLGVHRARFDIRDAREADLSPGTVFYLYTPFRGEILRAVLDALHAQAVQRPIRICTYGPCTTEVAAEPWLQPSGIIEPDRIAVFSASAATRGRPGYPTSNPVPAPLRCS